MAVPDEHAAAPDTGLSLRERGAATVHRLAEVGAKLHPLKTKLQEGKRLTKREWKTLDALDGEYRTLEMQMRELMRPRHRPEDVWLRGVDHLHGPDNPRDAGH